jgi:hypothetical protein
VREFGAGAGLTDLHEAGARRYARVFRPLQQQVRALGLGQHFPGERSADVLLRAAARVPAGVAAGADPAPLAAALLALGAERRASPRPDPRRPLYPSTPLPYPATWLGASGAGCRMARPRRSSR